LLLAPSPPLLFMGEEFAASTPFLFFCDFEGDLAKAVRDGRRAEFAKFRQFRDAATRDRIPDPNAEGTFLASKLDWDSQKKSQHMEWFNFYSHLLALRKREIVPLLRDVGGNSRKTSYTTSQANGLNACWHLDNKTLKLQANLSDDISSFEPSGRGLIYSTFAINQTGGMPPWSVAWFVNQ
jgi:1,4-alpha-glucan branching enzyme